MKFLLLIGLAIPSLFHAQYIETRDLSSETKEIQRLLGKIELISDLGQASSSSRKSESKAIMLVGIAATGLAIATVYSYPRYYRPYYYHPYPRPYPYHYRHRRYYRPNNTAVAIGATMATIGLAGAIAAAASSDAQATQNQGQMAAEKAQKRITEIISNLVITDEDFINESKELKASISNSVIQRVEELNTQYRNDLEIQDTILSSYQEKFETTTNNISIKKENIINDTKNQYSQNIEKLLDPSLSKKVAKTLKKYNVDLKKQEKESLKNLDKELKATIKEYKTESIKLEKKVDEKKVDISKRYDKQIEDLKKSAREKHNELVLRYIKIYSQKLTV